ncbi:MAG: serine hydrolase, partial [Bacteroidota bacterium]
MAKKRKRIRIFVGIVVTLLGVLLGVLYYILPVGSAFAAKTMCSCVFVADYPEDRVRKVELQTLSMFDVDVDYDQKRTTGSFLGLRPQVVVYRPGFGCSIAADADPDALQQTLAQLPQRHLLDSPAADTLPWPLGKRDTLPYPLGVDSAKLSRVVNGIFVEDFPEAKKNTRAALVVYQGKIVAEQYAPGFDSESLLRGWSMTKSVTNALLGRLVRDESFDIYQPAPVPEWQSPEDPRKAITTDMLLRMSSGLDFAEFYAFRTDATEMLFLSQDAAAYAAQSDLAHEPDTHWSYSSGTSNLLSRIIRKQFQDD